MYKVQAQSKVEYSRAPEIGYEARADTPPVSTKSCLRKPLTDGSWLCTEGSGFQHNHSSNLGRAKANTADISASAVWVSAVCACYFLVFSTHSKHFTMNNFQEKKKS